MGIVGGLLISAGITLVIGKIWEREEIKQFGKIQYDRNCDYVVCFLYFLALAIGYAL